MLGGTRFWSGRGPFGLSLGLALGAAQCGGKSDRDPTPSAPMAPRGGGAGMSGAATSGGSPATGGAASVPFDAFGCQGVPHVPESTPKPNRCGTSTQCHSIGRRTYFLVERSSTMAEPWGETTRWQFVRDAFALYKGTGASGGLGFSSAPAPSSSDACDAANYTAPATLFDWLEPESSMLSATLAEVTPSGKNPLLLALQGLIAFAEQVPTPPSYFRVVIVTATPPDECPSDVTIADIARVLADAAPKMDAVVVGLGALYDIEPLADAAGKYPFHLAATDPPRLLADVLGQITGSCLGAPWKGSCEGFTIAAESPFADSGFPNPEIVLNTRFGTESVPLLTGPADCATSESGGFFVDSSQTPTVLRLCPCSCVRTAWSDPITEVSWDCPAPKRDGEPCTYDLECISGHCYGDAPRDGGERVCITP